MRQGKWLAFALAAALLGAGCLTRPAAPGVAALAVDTADEGYRWTFHLMPEARVTTAARTLEQALGSLPRGARLDTLRQIALSRELTEQGLHPVVRQLLRQPDLPRGAAVTMGDAPEAEPAHTRLQHLGSRLHGAYGGDPVLPAGADALAILKGDRLAGVLSPAETATLEMLAGAPGPFIAEIADPRAPGRTLVLRFTQPAPPAWQTTVYRGRPHLTASLTLQANVLEGTPASRTKLAETAAGYWQKERIEPLLRKVYGEWGADPLALGQRFRLRFPTMDAWRDYRWDERVKTIQFRIDTAVLLPYP